VAGGIRELRDFLYLNLYDHPEVATANERAVAVMRDLFLHFMERPGDMGPGSAQRAETEGMDRVVCDYVAGMTDRYAFEEHGRLCRRGVT